MAKKINLSDISETTTQLFERSEIEKIKIVSKTRNSSSTFSNDTKIIIEHFLPLFILYSYFFYILPNDNSKLSNTISNILSSRRNERMISFSSEMDLNRKSDQNQIKESNKMIKKICISNCSKEDFKKRDFIQFNDSSNDKYHNMAFSCKLNERRLKNILLKINSTGSESTHIRIGIFIWSNRIEIRDIILKK